MKSSHIPKKKKKFFCTLVPIIMLKLMENLKKANVRQRKVNTVHLLRTSSTIRFTVFPVLIIEAISTLNLQKP